MFLHWYGFKLLGSHSDENSKSFKLRFEVILNLFLTFKQFIFVILKYSY